MSVVQQHPLDRLQGLVERLAEIAADKYSTEQLVEAASIHAEIIERYHTYKESGEPTERQKLRLKELNETAMRLWRDVRNKVPAVISDLPEDSLEQRIHDLEKEVQQCWDAAEKILDEWNAISPKPFLESIKDYQDNFPRHEQEAWMRAFNAMKAFVKKVQATISQNPQTWQAPVDPR